MKSYEIDVSDTYGCRKCDFRVETIQNDTVTMDFRCTRTHFMTFFWYLVKKEFLWPLGWVFVGLLTPHPHWFNALTFSRSTCTALLKWTFLNEIPYMKVVIFYDVRWKIDERLMNCDEIWLTFDEVWLTSHGFWWAFDGLWLAFNVFSMNVD